MTELNQVYKCNICGNMVEMVHKGAGQLVCCGQPMELKAPNTQDASQEKHVPTIAKTEKGFLVKVGSVPHPMEEKHYIEWIEIIANGIVYRKYLQPGQVPEAEFCTEAADIRARAYCNLHGLWQA